MPLSDLHYDTLKCIILRCVNVLNYFCNKLRPRAIISIFEKKKRQLIKRVTFEKKKLAKLARHFFIKCHLKVNIDYCSRYTGRETCGGFAEMTQDHLSQLWGKGPSCRGAAANSLGKATTSAMQLLATGK